MPSGGNLGQRFASFERIEQIGKPKRDRKSIKTKRRQKRK
jgi:hypothetical protein